ncbi:hypothetical protein NEHOM01_1112 [Nematocida homosporus]|uniref:uncharacterized protein n=1 Tax=Nematocida homosporus TaxID=1912981 RepID=UPI00221E72A1|nr:uncharacterized protein NEHOM01_1112 [Nematocida homosporus]KAI5185862.1 hypothetical protein NEHOM01_1112 [Nematocida homosporus]
MNTPAAPESGVIFDCSYRDLATPSKEGLSYQLIRESCQTRSTTETVLSSIIWISVSSTLAILSYLFYIYAHAGQNLVDANNSPYDFSDVLVFLGLMITTCVVALLLRQLSRRKANKAFNLGDALGRWFVYSLVSLCVFGGAVVLFAHVAIDNQKAYLIDHLFVLPVGLLIIGLVAAFLEYFKFKTKYPSAAKVATFIALLLIGALLLALTLLLTHISFEILALAASAGHT